MDEDNCIHPTTGPPINSEAPPPPTTPIKRKPVKAKLCLWYHFTIIVGGDRNRYDCNYCNKVCEGETDALWTHLNVQCQEYPYRLGDKRKNVPSDSPVPSDTPDEDSIEEESSQDVEVDINFDEYECTKRQQRLRVALAEMIVIDALPLRIVEGKGFKRFCHFMDPDFELPSRIEVARDVMKLYFDEKMKLRSLLTGNSRRVCLTTDIWTSSQDLNYMCLTAHFIDSEWKLQKKILNFCQIPDHKEKTVGKMVEVCLLNWGIKNVFSLTVDNANSNDEAVSHVKTRLRDWNGCVLDGEFLHVQCCAHIINLIVSEGLNDLHESIASIRHAVKYVRSSSARLEKLKECIRMKKIECKGLVVLDVPTWWNTTYLMLEAAIRFRKAFEGFAEEDGEFLSHFMDDEDGEKKISPPSSDDWNNVEAFVRFMKILYDASLKFNASLHVTSNTYFHELCEIQCKLIKWSQSKNSALSDMASSMKIKYDKYLGSINDINPLLFISLVLDPRYKMEYVKYCFDEFSNTLAAEMTKSVEVTLKRLYEYYSTQVPNDTQTSSRVDMEIDDSKISPCFDSFRKWLQENNHPCIKTEVDRYLLEPSKYLAGNEFDVLRWWKSNSSRYPVLSEIARDVLALPISTVGSESAFNIEGRFLDPYRSALSTCSPRTLALICTQSWLTSTPAPVVFREYMYDLEKFEEIEFELLEKCSLEDDPQKD